MKTQTCILCCALLLVACAVPAGGNDQGRTVEPGEITLPTMTASPKAPPLLVPTPSEIPAAPAFNSPEILSGLCDIFDNDLHEHDDDIPDWWYYRESGDKYMLRYPPDWQVVEHEDWIGFTPQEMEEGVHWGLYISRTQETSIPDAIRALGSQFEPDLVVRRECFRLGDQIALRAIILTPRSEGWVMVAVFLEHDGWIYQFENGAVPDDRFHYFYSSLRFR